MINNETFTPPNRLIIAIGPAPVSYAVNACLHSKRPLSALMRNFCRAGSFLAIFVGVQVLHAQPSSLAPSLRLEQSASDALDLVIDNLSSTGALFLLQADNLANLRNDAFQLLETNTPLNEGLRVHTPSTNAVSGQGYFSGVFFPDRSISEFGDPEAGPEPSTPAMVLLTAGQPVSLSTGQTFTIDFFITDVSGQVLNISGPVAIVVLRQSDGVLDPDAQVTPATAQLINGHVRAQITLQSSAPLDGYAIGLGPPSQGVSTSPVPMDASPLDSFLQSSCTLSPDPLADTTPDALLAAEQAFRHKYADTDTNWGYPLMVPVPQFSHAVSGTYGEWRGQATQREPTGHVHQGLDLAAPYSSTVFASRGGLVSDIGTITGEGAYIVIDHGDGWFSRYLHLNRSSIDVRPGQPVKRGDILATELYHVGNWPVHLHFEVRHDTDSPHYGDPEPGIGQDPLQTAGIFPVEPSAVLPSLKLLGLTRLQPGLNAFDEYDKEPAAADLNEPVYLVAQIVDLEPKSGGKMRHLGLKTVGFQPEGADQPDIISSKDEAAIALLRPPGVGQQHGFARYSPFGTYVEADPNDWFRYWWLWDTSPYRNDPRGPRTLVLTAQTYSGASTNYYLAFGPQIKDGTVTPLGSQQFRFTLVAYLGTNSAALTQPDQYIVAIIQANGSVLPDVIWDTPISWNWDPLILNNVTPVITAHLQTSSYTFTLPPNTDPTGLRLRVSSLLAPDIADEVPVVPERLALWNYGDSPESFYAALDSQGLGQIQVAGNSTNYVALPAISAGTDHELEIWAANMSYYEDWSFDVILPAGLAFESVQNVNWGTVTPISGSEYSDFWVEYPYTPGLRSHDDDIFTIRSDGNP